MFAIAAIAMALTFELPPVRSRATWGPLPFPFAAACLQPLLLAAMVLRSSVDPGAYQWRALRKQRGSSKRDLLRRQWHNRCGADLDPGID
jgi:hypothetical protein